MGQDWQNLKPLGVMILALLRETDMHPYEMMRLLKQRRDDRLVRIQNGTFYHQVGVLERDGYLAEVSVDRDGARPERTTYTVLPAGVDAIINWVRSRLPRIDKPADFRVALAEAHNLSREEAVNLLDQRVLALTAQHDAQRAAKDHAAAMPIDPQFLLEVDRDTALIAADIAWTSAARDRISDESFQWGVPSQEHRAAKSSHFHAESTLPKGHA